MKKTLYYAAFSLFFSLSSVTHAAPLVTEAWQSPALLKQPESVVFDILRQSLYVSNINGDPTQADQNGFISLLDLEGNISKLEWVTGLNAPKGMAMFGNKLFVADLNTLVVIDVETATIVQRFTTTEDSFLNDVAINSAGVIYVTDTLHNKIYRLYRGKLETWLVDPRLENPNGIYLDNQHIFIASWGVPTEGWNTKVPGHLLQLTETDKTLQDFGSNKPIGNLDGVAKLGDNAMLVTDWMAGTLLQVNGDGSSQLVAELEPGVADMLYLRSRRMLYIPLMNAGKLTAYIVTP
ncbi:hypothetical protein ACFVYJ_04755 [Pontibacter sp. JAM-7]|uniref:hypothetical protein n=1 Tax=Pontibacter sp. JAM-7 TaxID=3366581 RepID=UPI003AF439F7